MFMQRFERSAHRSPAFAATRGLVVIVVAVAACSLFALPLIAQDSEGEATESLDEFTEVVGPRLDWGFEAKAHFRSSDDNAFSVPFPFSPEMIPAGVGENRLETVNPDDHFEISTVTLLLDAIWSESLAAHVKLDFVDLYDRNPTSGDRQYDVDEAWVRFGRESFPALLPESAGAYLKIGKMPKFERQNDRHLESYGLLSTAFNRFEDVGVEFGADLGRFVYVRLTATQGNPLFMRDPNALAGDNGTDEIQTVPPDPTLGTGIPILYDAEVEGLDVDGELETGAGLGFRWSSEDGNHGVDLLVWGYQRDLAETVKLEGTFYGGDLDLLRGPFNLFEFPISGKKKEEVGANFWLYLGPFSLFSQVADQEVAGLGRQGVEVETAWSFELPLRWAVAGRQLFPRIQPAIRYSQLEHDFGPPPITPSPSLAWDWEKLDYGLRIGILDQIELTLEYSDNTFIRIGRDESNDEFLTTLRWGM